MSKTTISKYLTGIIQFNDGQGGILSQGTLQVKYIYLNGVLLDLSTYATSSQIIAINNSISAIQTTLTTCSYDSTNQTFSVGNNLKCLGTFTLYIGGVAYNVNTFITNTNSNITTNTSDISTIKTKLTDCSYNSTSGAFQIGGTTDCRILNTLYLYNGSTPYNLNTYITNNSTNITSLVNKTTDISYNGTTTTTTIGNNLVINNIDGYSKTQFDNAINFTKSLTKDAQTQINELKDALIAVGLIQTVSNVVVYTGFFFTIEAEIIAVSARVTTCEENIGTLLYKCTKISYSDTTDTTTIAGAQLTVTNTIACSSLETSDIKSSGNINQIYVNNKNNTFRNPTYFQHNVELQNNKGFLIDAGCTFENNGLTTINGNLTCTGASTNLNSITTQIGTNSSTSTLNTYATANFYGPTLIRNNSLTSSGTISPYLNILSIATNTNARKLQGVVVGIEQILNNQSNANLGYNYVSDGSSSNYGYLGLNTNSLNVIESLRWSPTKVIIQNGNFEVANNSSILGSLTCNTIQNNGANGTPLAITCTGVNNNMVLTSSANVNLFANSGAIKLNSNDIQIGTNQSASVNNVVSIGTIASNTTCIIPNIVKTNNITGYNTGSVLSINNPTISIGANQGVGVVNSISIGNTTSGSIISLNGAVLVNGYMSNITNLSLSGIFTQF